MNQIVNIVKNPYVYAFILGIILVFSFNLYQENKGLELDYYNLEVKNNQSLELIDDLEDDIVMLNKNILKLNKDLNYERDLNKNLTNELSQAEKEIDYLTKEDTVNVFDLTNINITYIFILTLVFMIPLSFTLFDLKFKLIEIKINIKNKNFEKVIEIFKWLLIIFIIIMIVYILGEVL